MKVRKYRLHHTKPLSAMLAPMIVWTFATVLSAGLLLPFFIVYILREMINNTVIEHYSIHSDERFK